MEAGDISSDDRGRVVVVVEPFLLDGGATSLADGDTCPLHRPKRLEWKADEKRFGQQVK